MIERFKSVFQEMAAVSKASGKSILSQCFELRRLRQLPQSIRLSDYFSYELYDDRKFSEQQKREFVGWAAEESYNLQMVAEHWSCISFDKILFYSLLQAAGLPYPKIFAIYSETGRLLSGVRTLASETEVEIFLREHSPFPVFLKPSHGNFGYGADLLESFDTTQDAIVSATKGPIGIKEFTAALDVKFSNGQLFQEVIVPHPEIEAACGRRISTVRIVVVRLASGYAVHKAVWKLNAGGNVVDNFMHGKTGNLLAPVNVDDGSIARVVGMGSDMKMHIVDCHPDTGASLSRFTIPGWNDICEVAINVARTLPLYRMVHLDIAASDRGPLCLEVNSVGNMDLHQHASGSGFLTEPLVTALADAEQFKVEYEQRKARRAQGNSGGA